MSTTSPTSTAATAAQAVARYGYVPFMLIGLNGAGGGVADRDRLHLVSGAGTHARRHHRQGPRPTQTCSYRKWKRPSLMVPSASLSMPP